MRWKGGRRNVKVRSYFLRSFVVAFLPPSLYLTTWVGVGVSFWTIGLGVHDGELIKSVLFFLFYHHWESSTTLSSGSISIDFNLWNGLFYLPFQWLLQLPYRPTPLGDGQQSSLILGPLLLFFPPTMTLPPHV